MFTFIMACRSRAKSDSDDMFYLQSYQGLIIDRSFVYQPYPKDRINAQVIYQFALAQVGCVHVNVLLTIINKT